MAIRTTVNRLENILQTEFNLERIPIQRYTVFDARCMEPDGHVEDPPSREVAGAVARIIEPGYWISLPDGNKELYRRARVRLYKGKHQ